MWPGPSYWHTLLNWSSLRHWTIRWARKWVEIRKKTNKQIKYFRKESGSRSGEVKREESGGEGPGGRAPHEVPRLASPPRHRQRRPATAPKFHLLEHRANLLDFLMKLWESFWWRAFPSRVKSTGVPPLISWGKLNHSWLMFGYSSCCTTFLGFWKLRLNINFTMT